MIERQIWYKCDEWNDDWLSAISSYWREICTTWVDWEIISNGGNKLKKIGVNAKELWCEEGSGGRWSSWIDSDVVYRPNGWTAPWH